MKLIDLTHKITNGMPVYPGDKPPKLTQTHSVEKDGFGKFELSSAFHAGTHLDAPLHMIAGGKLISDYQVGKFFGPGVVIDARGKEKIDAQLLDSVSISQGDIAIVVTGWYKNFGTDKYFKNPPLVTLDFARKLAESKPSILAMDTPGPDDSPFEVHKLLLGQEILIVENLTNTEALLGKSFEIIALPINIAADASLVRMVAKITQ